MAIRYQQVGISWLLSRHLNSMLQHVATRHHQAQLLFVQVFSCDPAKTKPSRKLSSEWFWRTKWEKFWEVKVQKNRAPHGTTKSIGNHCVVKTPFWGLIPPFQTDPNQDPLALADIIYCWASPPRKGRAQNLLPVELHWTTCLVTLSTKPSKFETVKFNIIST